MSVRKKVSGNSGWWASLLILVALVCVSCKAQKKESGPPVQKAVMAGSFYPADPKDLSTTVRGYLQEDRDRPMLGEIRAIIAPHASYEYSGVIAGKAYAALNHPFRRFIILAANHNNRTPFFKAAIPGVDAFETPLGRVKVSPVVGELMKKPEFSVVPQAFVSHVIEVQLPFLQVLYKDFEIVPIVLGNVSSEETSKFVQYIGALADKDTGIIVSSDLSHYHPYDDARARDGRCIQAIEADNLPEMSRCEACGLPAILILSEIAREKGWRPHVLGYANSGDSTGGKESVVGYSAIVFDDLNFPESRPDTPTPAAAPVAAGSGAPETLLKLARSTIESLVRTGSSPTLSPSGNQRKRACFVTLKKEGELRGCIGDIRAEKSLSECVRDNAINAAANDRRFSPVKEDELGNLKIEISVLSEPRIVQKDSPQGLLDAIHTGSDGVILQRGNSAAVYLPQVWEQLPDKEKFLASLCRKGGMNELCWKDPDTRLEVFQAEVFGE